MIGHKEATIGHNEALSKVFQVLKGNRRQVEICEASGISASQISCVSTGLRYPSRENLKKLARALGYSEVQVEMAVALVRGNPVLGDDGEALLELISDPYKRSSGSAVIRARIVSLENMAASLAMELGDLANKLDELEGEAE